MRATFHGTGSRWAASGGTVGYNRYTYRGSNVLYESDSVGTVTRSYTWGGTNRLLTFHEGSAHYYVIADRLGSVRSVLGADGSWLISQRFTPYGARQSVDSAGSYPALPYGWTGREYDPETGFYYLRARYYMPLLRRFVQADPAGYGGGSNLYAYVGGDPLEAIDPTGMQAADWYQHAQGSGFRGTVWGGTFGSYTEYRPSLFGREDANNLIIHEELHAEHHDWSEHRVCFMANRIAEGTDVKCY